MRDDSIAHDLGSFYEVFLPPQAKQLWDRFDFVFTLKDGNWLNVAEIVLDVLTRKYLNRRVDNIKNIVTSIKRK